MTLVAQIKCAAADALKHLFPEADIQLSMITVNQTKPEFTGDYTIVLFPFVKQLRQKPDVLGNQLGSYLVEKNELFTEFQIVSGFLNLTISDSYWTNLLVNHFNDAHFGEKPKQDRRVMVEYSSPNTNKPLHFGHLRNNFLGFAMGEILKANGNQVVKANLINDRGIHICKSMIAWQRFADGATPESTDTKGDHLVGDYYVKFNDILKEQTAPIMDRIFHGDFDDLDAAAADKAAKLIAAYNKPEVKDDKDKADKIKGDIKEIAQNHTEIQLAAKEMLRQWEAGDLEVRKLWETMNGWVYQGFSETYKRLGVDFDKMYYESETYLLGKEIVVKGLEKGVLFKKEDGSVWIDLTADGLDEKLLLRGDGTSVYMTQDLGTAVLKYNDFKLNQSIYVIADEQNYHMQVLKLILEKLGEPCADGVFHLSYGMVELPTGRMKSREGTVVDADDMINEMLRLAQEQTEEAGKTEGFTQEELKKLYNTIGLGALKFYLLRVDPKKKMIFDPKESIDLHGFTATFIQYAHARICSILRKEHVAVMPDNAGFHHFKMTAPFEKAEKDLIITLDQYPMMLESAAAEYNPSQLCSYAFHLAQLFNTFYDQHSIANAESEEKKQLRLMLIVMTAQILRRSMKLCGINLPEKM
ncbi:arginine--tRNA ligase [Taibaiella soli]|uniref:Arginine--tRNA ligase n=1 Tax=Taibaiella soli TaxID=1649169 RepID=A0A2W2AM03_9BACT|nr:arginine--tRNA ligase [Taibaiella soli]PZF73330.1 arginine--tRNA ligase [Taibaiella soli]